MSVPKYYEFYKPLLDFLRDGQLHTFKEIRPAMASYFHLGTEELAEMLPSGRQTVFRNRVGWCSTYLKKAGLVESPTRAALQITAEGQKALQLNPEGFGNEYLLQYESFREFQNLSKTVSVEKLPSTANLPVDEDTPDVLLEKSYQKIVKELADNLLSEVMELSPKAFEHMVVSLIAKLYGTSETSGYLTPYTGDEGIDGIVKEDKLGFSLIYIQAKQWAPSHPVGRPDIQAFVGAIAGRGGKGLFVTTGIFSKPAIDYADNRHIILVDGENLANLMIENDFGVTVRRKLELKSIDTDFFHDYKEDADT